MGKFVLQIFILSYDYFKTCSYHNPRACSSTSILHVKQASHVVRVDTWICERHAVRVDTWLAMWTSRSTRRHMAMWTSRSTRRHMAMWTLKPKLTRIMPVTRARVWQNWKWLLQLTMCLRATASTRDLNRIRYLLITLK